MARAFASASSQYLTVTNAALSADPITMAAWMYPLQDNVTGIVLSITDHDATTGRWSLRAQSTGVVSAIKSQDDGTSGNAVSSASYTANAWNHAVAVFSHLSSRTAYVNGGNSGTNTTTITNELGPSATSIGVQRFFSNTDYFNGYIAHAAIWSVALSASEVAKLYNSGIGVDPRSVRPDALVAYWPLINGDGDQDYWGNFHLTASGSPTYAQHPPVLMRSRPKYVILGSAAPSIATIEIAGTRQVGNTLTCNATSSPSGATFAYQWYMADNILGTNQTAISGATSQTYELSYANIGAATKLYEGLDANGEAFIACGATPTKDAVEGDETVSSYVAITEAAATAPVGSPFESAYIR